MRIEKRGFALAFLAALTLFFCLLGASGAARAADSYQLSEDTSKWAGTLTNVVSNPTVKPKFELKDEGATFIGIPIPSLYFSLTIKVGIECDFDLDIRQGTLQGIEVNDEITEYTHGLSNEKISDNLFDYLPSLFTIGFNMDSFLKVGATAPIQLKGRMKNIGGLELSTEKGLNVVEDHYVDFTSVRPKEPNKRVVFYVGTQFKETLKIGYINILDLVGVGPIFQGDIGFMGGGIGAATLQKDLVNMHNVPDDTRVLHTCVENGKEGCVDGRWRMIHHMYGNISVNLQIKLLTYDIVIYSHEWPMEDIRRETAFQWFDQSLTWGEPLKKENGCSHILCKVSAALWHDFGKTAPVRDWTGPIHPVQDVHVDPNARHLTSVVPNGEGKATLYLPYIKGKYTLISESGGVTATGRMSENMFISDDHKVDLFLGTGEERIYSVEKKWDIDIEDKDRPESVQVLLQRNSYNDSFKIFKRILSSPEEAWTSIQLVELNEANNWSAEFDPVPSYEYDAEGNKWEIRYRVRELRQPGPDDQYPDLPEYAGNRVILGRYDLENTHIWEQLKGRMTNWQTYWQLEPTQEGLESFLKVYMQDALYPFPTVTMKVPKYTNLAGEEIEEHNTLYRVEYTKEEGDKDENPRRIKMTITNTAVLSINTYKRWIAPKDAELPDYVLLSLLSRPQKAYLNYLPASVRKFASMWLPVYRPLEGDHISLASLVGLDFLAELDTEGYLKIPLAIAKVNKPSEDAVNPLIQWRARFLVKKYGYLGFDGIPVEFEGAELTSTVLQNLIKFLTGIDFPVSISLLNGFVTVPGKAYQIPVLDQEWEKTANVINIMLSPDDNPDPDDPSNVAIGGVKYWQNDQPANRPTSITLHIKDGETPVAKLILHRVGNNLDTFVNGTLVRKTLLAEDDGDPQGGNVWPWALKQSDLPNGPTLDPNKTYTVTEEALDGYFATVRGHDIINTYIKGVRKYVQVWKYYKGKMIGTRPYTVEGTMTQENGATEPIELTRFPDVYGNPSYGYFTNDMSFPQDADLSKLQFKENEEYSRGYQTTYSGPELEEGSTFVYTITNSSIPQKKYAVVIEKKWAGDKESERPKSIRLTILRDGEEWIKGVTLPRGKNNWTFPINRGLVREDGNPCLITVLEEVPEGYTCSVKETKTVTDTQEITYLTLTNTKIPEEEMVTVKGTKTWNDNNNSGNTRPDHITLHIRNNKFETVKTLTVTAADHWEWSVPKLPGKDAEGNALTYYVTEEPVQVQRPGGSGSAGTEYYVTGYSAPVYDEASRTWSCDIINALRENTTLITIQKVWDDQNNERKLRPDSVTVEIYEKREGSGSERLMMEAELNAGNDWRYDFRTLKTEGASYSIKEQAVLGYIATIAGSGTPNAEGHVSFNVTNTLRKYITVQKIWEDHDDILGKRPDSVDVRVIREPNGNINVGTITKENDWKYTFESVNIPLWDEHGQAIDYTLAEYPIEEYSTVVTGSALEGFTVTNTLRPHIRIEKVWNDYGSEGKRPESVKARLTCPAIQLDEVVEISNDGWELTLDPDQFPVLDENGNPLTYTLSEVAVPGYDSVVVGSARDGFTIINTVEQNISITKEWVDGGYVNRPRAAYVQLTKTLPNGTKGTKEITLTREDKWTVSVDPADPLFPAGPGTYSVTETPIEGYTYSVSGDAGSGFVVTNTRATVDISVRKVWKHGANPESGRPASVRVVLKKGNQMIATVILNAANNWQYTFSGWPCLHDGSEYTVQEWNLPAGYTSERTRTAGDGKTENTAYTITNTYEKQTMEVRVSKVWESGSLPPYQAPIMVRIYAKNNPTNPATTKDATLDVTNNWTYLFTDLPIYNYTDEGSERNIYAVKEVSPPAGYEFYVTGDQDDGFIIHNTQKTGIKITKVWNDGGAGGRTAVTIRIKGLNVDEIIERRGEKLKADDGWTKTFSDLPVYDKNGQLMEYAVTEEPVEGYKTTVTGNARDGYTIVNTLKEQLSITKRWVDGNDVDHRPNPVKVYLKRVDVSGSTPQQIVLTAEENWTKLLNRDQFPVEGVYTLTEEPLNGYTYSYVREGNIFVLTNTRAMMSVSVRKEWKHGANTDAHPTPVTVQLKKGNQVLKTATLDEEHNWQHTFDNLPFLQDGSEYTVDEVNIPADYTKTITRSGNGKTEYTSFTITNTYVKQTRNITVKKVWQGDGASVRPKSVKVRIRAGANGRIYGEATLTAPDWQHTFKNLPVYYDQSETDQITYTVEEINPPERYTSVVTENAQHTEFTITNTLKNEIPVYKVWNDDQDASGRRPISVTVQLKKDNVVIDTAELNDDINDDNYWSHTFTGNNIQLFDSNGQKINYTLEELTVPGYKSEKSGSALEGFVVTNTLKPRITIKKVWNDNDNAENHRPNSIRVHLLGANGEQKATEVLNEANNWSCSLDPDTCPVYDADGRMITYSVTEDPVAYYDTAVSGDAREGFTVVNTLKGRISITKLWVDGDYSGRPTAVTVYLTRTDVSGSSPEPVTLKAYENWTTVLDAEKFPAGGRYTLTEEPMNGYTWSFVRNGNIFLVKNTRATMGVSVHKAWDHGVNPSSQWPKSVTVQLKKGEQVLESVILNEGNSWQHTFDNLDFLQDGSEYTVDEVNIPAGYTRTIACTGDGKTGFTSYIITNTYVHQTMNVPVTKVWVGNDELCRPESVRVKIRARQNPEICDEATLSESNGWKYTFRNLRASYDYEVEELANPAYTTSVTGSQTRGFTITNTLKTIDIWVRKTWDDDNNKFNNRPETVQITLRGNGGSAYSSYLAPDSRGTWAALLQKLPKYELTAGGDYAEISYELIENDVPGYTSSAPVYSPDEQNQTGTFTLTNTASRERINLIIEKKWAGEGKWQAAYRPTEVNVTIAGGGKEYPLTLRASENWRTVITDLPLYVDGKKANYFLNEWEVHGYYATTKMSGPELVDGVQTYTYTLTNTLILMDIPVAKYWWDEEKNHPPVTLVLFSNREAADEDLEIARMTLTEADADPSAEGTPWKGKFTNLPVYTADGREIKYTLLEEPVEGYDDPIILKQSEQGSGEQPFLYTSFEVYNFPLPKIAEASAIKYWEDNEDALGIRPDEVITHLWNGDEEVGEILLTGENENYGEIDNLPLNDEEGRRITYTLTEEALHCYESEIYPTVLEIYGRRIFLFFVQNTLREDACVLTYDPNGGILEGSTEPLKEGHRVGDEVQIHRAPTREGYVFLYWKGSEYYPGDDYTVTGDHTFVAQWVREDALDHKFTFTKRWSGTPGESIDWTFYDAEDQVVRKRFNKKVVSEAEWQYTAWFDSPREYYLVEKPVPGYETIYQNVGKYADITDRCYNGGTIINYRAPNTGDESRPLLWIALGAAGLLLLIALVIKHRRKR